MAALALGGATLHLGRPAYAYRALKMWRRSWLSREVALFGAFSLAAAVYAGALLALEPAEAGSAAALGGLCALLGLVGVTASACIYRVPSRPAWNTRFTLFQFNLTAATLGPLLVVAVGASDAGALAFTAAAMAGAQLLLVALHFVRLVAADRIELKGTARLLATTLKPQFIARGLLLGAGGSARAVAFHVAELIDGGSLIISNRTLEHAASLAAEVSHLEDRLDEMKERLELWVLRAASEQIDPSGLRGLVHLAQASEEIGDAAVQMVWLVEQGEELHPIQRAFNEQHGLQCGFCTPGFLVAAADLLERSPNPDEEQIREELSGNICRCTGYVHIVRAVQQAADDLREKHAAGSGRTSG